MKSDAEYMELAIEEARKSASDGGIPIAACLVDNTGEVVAVGHNEPEMTPEEYKEELRAVIKNNSLEGLKKFYVG